jgi:hypothetical protein
VAVARILISCVPNAGGSSERDSNHRRHRRDTEGAAAHFAFGHRGETKEGIQRQMAVGERLALPATRLPFGAVRQAFPLRALSCYYSRSYGNSSQ